MNEDQPPPPSTLAPASTAGLVIRERGAELVPHRPSRMLIPAGLVAASLGLAGAVILSGSALPFLLLGPLLAGGLLLTARAERSAARRRFESVPLAPAADELPLGARVRVWGRVVGSLSPHPEMTRDAQAVPMMLLQPVAIPSSEFPVVELRGQDFLMVTEAGMKVAVLIRDGWLFDDDAAAMAARGELRPVCVQPGDQLEVVGTVGRVIHVQGDGRLGRTPPSIAALGSTQQAPLLVRKRR